LLQILLGESRVSLLTPPSTKGEGDFIGFLTEGKSVLAFYWPDTSVEPTIVRMELFRFLNAMTVLRALTSEERATLYEGVGSWQRDVRANLASKARGKDAAQKAGPGTSPAPAEALTTKRAASAKTAKLEKELATTTEKLAESVSKVAELSKQVTAKDKEISQLRKAGTVEPEPEKAVAKAARLQTELTTSKGEVRDLESKAKGAEKEQDALQARLVASEKNAVDYQRQYEVAQGRYMRSTSPAPLHRRSCSSLWVAHSCNRWHKLRSTGSKGGPIMALCHSSNNLVPQPSLV